MTAPLYVGYLPLRARHARFIKLFVPLSLAAIALLAIGISVSQRPPGTGRWDGEPNEWRGTLVTAPYPILIAENGHASLLVEIGKHGPRAEAGTFEGERVVVMGRRIERDGRRIIELVPGDDAIQSLGAGSPPPLVRIGPPVTLRGEILDSKCYLGAMRPGDGKAHKACATLCVAGGIPPMLHTRESGLARYHLLATPDLEPVKQLVLPYVGEPIAARGQPAQIADLPLFLIEGNAIARTW